MSKAKQLKLNTMLRKTKEDKVITQKNLIMDRVKFMIEKQKEKLIVGEAQMQEKEIAFRQGYIESLEILLLDLKYDDRLKTQVDEIK